jgi:hypothetical protein
LAISEGYLKLFGGPAIVQVTFHDFTSQGGGDWRLFVGREKGTCITPDVKMDVRFRTPRWFTRRGDVWRQLHHHGSIEEPDCLQRIRRQSSERRWARRHEPRLPNQPVWLAGNCWLEASQPLPESLRVSFFSIPMV